MGNLLTILSEICSEIADRLRAKDPKEGQRSVLGESEFEKEDPGFAWVVILGLFGLSVVGGIYMIR